MAVPPRHPEKVALVTGASRGLGRVLARFLAEQGYGLLLTARGEVGLREVAEELRPFTSNVVSIAGDVTDAGHRDCVLEAARAWRRIDILVNNASELGPSPLPSLEAASRDDFVRVLEVNVLAPLALIREALPLLRISQGPPAETPADPGTRGA